MNVLIFVTLLIQTIVCDYDKRVITTLKYSKYVVTPTVINGKPAVEGQFPYLVSFKEPVNRIEPLKIVWRNFCGGSIIDKRRVLTAAHCFESNQFQYARFPGVLRVVAGDLKTTLVHSGQTETTDDAQWRKVKKVVLHQHFIFPDNDIALAFVDKPWIFTDKIKYVRMAKKVADYTNQCHSAGYGRIGISLNDPVSSVLLTASIKPMSRSRCALVWEMDMNTFICTEFVLTDVDKGDSGGPLTCEHTGDPNEVDESGVLVGVVSGKNYDKTTLYTRVSAYHSWIEKGGVDKLRVNLYLVITLFILIYLLFLYLLCFGEVYSKAFVMQ